MFFVELEASAPKFVAELKDVSVKIGEEARFDVTIAANPEPDLKWYVTTGPCAIIFLRAYSRQAKVGSKAKIIKTSKRIKEQAKESKNKRETSKKIFAFARSELALKVLILLWLRRADSAFVL